jgi:hypothetical protein
MSGARPPTRMVRKLLSFFRNKLFVYGEKLLTFYRYKLIIYDEKTSLLL